MLYLGLYIVLSVTYYLELRNTIFMYCISRVLPTNVKLVLWTLRNTNNFTLVKD